jgi:hypothetical protein
VIGLVPKYGRAKLDEGEKFLQFVRTRLVPHGITFWSYDDPLFQHRGESLQGCEVKLDNRCTETGRLSIEISEKSDPALRAWVASGILKEDNSWAYIQGNYELVFVFSKKWLVRWYEKKNPEIYEAHGTIRKFYLPMRIAHIASIFVVDGEGRRVQWEDRAP